MILYLPTITTFNLSSQVLELLWTTSPASILPLFESYDTSQYEAIFSLFLKRFRWICALMAYASC